MKIISKHKDYYDYCVAKFGLDESRVYDRRGVPPFNRDYIINKIKNKENFFWVLSVCGEYYPFIIHNKVLYHKNNLPPKTLAQKREFWGFNDFLNKKSELNLKYRKPVLYCLYSRGELDCAEDFVPNLSEFCFNSVMDAEEIYQKIYDFLGYLIDNPPIPDNQTDKEKVLSHGFDLKKSFRPKIKSLTTH